MALASSLGLDASLAGLRGRRDVATELADPQLLNGRGPSVHAVTAWLVGMGAVSCPSSTPDVPSDTPFDPCGGSWLTPDAAQPVQRIGSGYSIVPPAGAITVQPGAYEEFASDPAPEADGVGFQPRLGTYLVHMVIDPRPGADPPSGWQVVARLAP